MNRYAARGQCRHCKERKVNRPKRLCFACYYTPAVRASYPSDSKYAPRSDEQPRANTMLLRCDHCGDEHQRKAPGPGGKAIWPAGWRRVELTESGSSVVECPDCSVAWDVEQMRRGEGSR